MKIKLAIIFLLIFNSLLFAADNFKERSEIEKLKYSLKVLDEHTLILGFDLGAGTSFPIYKRVNNSDVSPGFSYAINARLMFFLSKEFGMLFDLGIQSFNIYESHNNIEITHKLFYAFLNYCPFFRFKKFYFYLGPYIGIILKGKKKDAISTTGETKDFKKPDLGISIGFGFLLGEPDKTLYNLGLEIKYQLNNFMKEEDQGNRCFTIYLRTGIYFSTKHSIR